VDADRIALTGIRLATGYGLYVAERLLGHSVTPASPQTTTQTSARCQKWWCGRA